MSQLGHKQGTLLVLHNYGKMKSLADFMMYRKWPNVKGKEMERLELNTFTIGFFWKGAI